MSYNNLRIGRFSEPGRAYSITTVTHRRFPLFQAWSCARILIREMKALSEYGIVESIAWVVMPDHLHWLFVLQRGDIGSAIKLLKGRSAKKLKQECSINKVWQPTYYDRAIRDNEDIRALARYIVANPLRAGLVRKLGDYPHWDAQWL